MAMRLYVGNLPYSINQQGLQDLFSQYGNVTSANVIIDKFSGRSKGFGFVEYDSDDSAKEAIAQLNGKEVDGRALRVNEARPMEERSRSDRGSFGGNRGGFRSRN